MPPGGLPCVLFRWLSFWKKSWFSSLHRGTLVQVLAQRRRWASFRKSPAGSPLLRLTGDGGQSAHWDFQSSRKTKASRPTVSTLSLWVVVFKILRKKWIYSILELGWNIATCGKSHALINLKLESS